MYIVYIKVERENENAQQTRTQVVLAYTPSFFIFQTYFCCYIFRFLIFCFILGSGYIGTKTYRFIPVVEDPAMVADVVGFLLLLCVLLMLLL